MYIYIVRTKTKNSSWTQRCIQYFNYMFHKSSYGGPGRELTRNGTITALPYQFNVRRSRFPPVLCQSRECMKLISYFVRFWRPPLFLRKKKCRGSGAKRIKACMTIMAGTGEESIQIPRHITFFVFDLFQKFSLWLLFL